MGSGQLIGTTLLSWDPFFLWIEVKTHIVAISLALALSSTAIVLQTGRRVVKYLYSDVLHLRFTGMLR
jgi:hypothetical protein